MKSILANQTNDRDPQLQEEACLHFFREGQNIAINIPVSIKNYFSFLLLPFYTQHKYDQI
jgi:hypothetical protein